MLWPICTFGSTRNDPLWAFGYEGAQLLAEKHAEDDMAEAATEELVAIAEKELLTEAVQCAEGGCHWLIWKGSY